MLKDEKHTALDELLDEVFSTEPEYTLQENFADTLARKAGQRFVLEQYFREFLIYLGVLLGIAAVSAGLAFVWYGANVTAWLNFLTSHVSLVAGINVLIVFVLLADKVLLPYLFYRSSLKKA